eukprot:3347807-Prymnesium_polylepis.2
MVSVHVIWRAQAKPQPSLDGDALRLRVRPLPWAAFFGQEAAQISVSLARRASGVIGQQRDEVGEMRAMNLQPATHTTAKA